MGVKNFRIMNSRLELCRVFLDGKKKEITSSSFICVYSQGVYKQLSADGLLQQ